MNLSEITVGKSVIIENLLCAGKARQRLIDLGIFVGREVLVAGFAPLGDPMIIEIAGSRVAIRKSAVREIICKLL